MTRTRELPERMAAVRRALASQRLEGLEPDAQTIADLHALAREELTLETLLQRLHQRVTRGELRTRATPPGGER